MLIYSGLCHEYIKCTKKVGKLIGNFVEWDPSTNTFTYFARPFQKIIFLCILFMIFQNIYALTVSTAEKTSTHDFWIVFTAMFTFIGMYCLETSRNLDIAGALMSGLVDFESRFCKNGKNLTVQEKKALKSAQKTCSLLTMIGIGPVGFGLGLISVLLPKSMLNLLFYAPGKWLVIFLTDTLTSFGLYQILSTILANSLIFLGNALLFTVWYGTGITLCNMIVTSTLSFTVAIGVFSRRLVGLTSNKIPGGGQVLPSSDNSDKYLKVVQMYREIQILACYFNQLNSIVLVSMVVVAVLGQIVSVVSLLTQSDTADAQTDLFLRAFYFEGMVLDIVTINFIFGKCADVFVESTACVSKLTHMSTVRRSKLLRRIVYSMPSIKVTFGRTNFIDRITPVVFQQFTNEKIVDTLLLQN